ncbi:hypothetical protein NL108_006930 [Boleophthalmus pectinirostris]|nr:hypothetical protein NL108_006930 [Boleophthalmus pectinirostris]
MTSYKDLMMYQLSSFLYQRLYSTAQDILGHVEKVLTEGLEGDRQGTGLDFPDSISAAPLTCITFGDGNQPIAPPAPQEAHLSSTEEFVLSTSGNTAQDQYLQETRQEGGTDVLQEQDSADQLFEDVEHNQPERDKLQTDSESYNDDTNEAWRGQRGATPSRNLKTKVSEQLRNIKEEVTQSTERPHCSDVSGKGFTHKSSPRVHECAHRGDILYICDVCKKSFITINELKIHKCTQTGKKTYQCDISQKSFTTRSKLKVHECRHTGERPYHCDVCQKSFRTRSNLKVHERRHTGKTVSL